MHEKGTIMAKASRTKPSISPQDLGACTKLDRLIELLKRPDGADLPALMTATGWQSHSVRGALAGSLKRKGHHISSEKVDGVRKWRILSGEGGQ